jgi:hypothetical protein
VLSHLPVDLRQRNLIRVTAVLTGLSLVCLVLLLMQAGGGMGLGTIHVSAHVSGDGISVTNLDDYPWANTTVRFFPGLDANFERPIGRLAAGASYNGSLGGMPDTETSGGLVLITCDQPGSGRIGFWIGFAD